ncbi:MAG TPA: dynamin family protein [Thermomonospora sp.]|nr:dynamin family protein [Thermomonospora sp.]
MTDPDIPPNAPATLPGTDPSDPSDSAQRLPAGLHRYAELRDEVIRLCDAVAETRPPSARERTLEAARAEVAAPFTVVVCGEFSRGKSSLLNAFVERPGLFHVDTAVTTSVVT